MCVSTHLQAQKGTKTEEFINYQCHAKVQSGTELQSPDSYKPLNDNVPEFLAKHLFCVSFFHLFWFCFHVLSSCLRSECCRTSALKSSGSLTIWKFLFPLKLNSHCIMSKKMGMVALRSSGSGTSVTSRIGPTIAGMNFILWGPARKSKSDAPKRQHLDIQMFQHIIHIKTINHILTRMHILHG